jgi:hypothetical protein
MCSKQNHHGYPLANHEPMPANLSGLPIIPASYSKEDLNKTIFFFYKSATN